MNGNKVTTQLLASTQNFCKWSENGLERGVCVAIIVETDKNLSFLFWPENAFRLSLIMMGKLVESR